MKFKVPKSSIVLILLVLTLSGFTHSYSATSSNLTNINLLQKKVNVLVLSSGASENSFIQSSLSGLNTSLVNVTFNLLSSKPLYNLSNFQVVIVSEMNKGSIYSELEKSLLNYIRTSGNKSVMIFSPYLDELKDDLLLGLGIKSLYEVSHDDHTFNSSNWSINITDTGFRSKGFTNSSYRGPISLIEPLPTAQVVATGREMGNTGSNMSKAITYTPVSVMQNGSTGQFITSGFNLISSSGKKASHSSELAVQQYTPQSFIDFGKFISLIVKSQVENIQVKIIGGGTSSVTSNSNTNNSGILIPNIHINLDPIQQITLSIIGLLVLIGLFFRKVSSVLNFLVEKSWILSIFFVGSLYNLSNRQLNNNEVLMNRVRELIMQYLEHVGKYGAHLREVKAALDLGMGNLLWHLQILEEYGWVEQFKIGRFNVYVATEFINQFDIDLKETELELKSKHTINILQTLLNEDLDSFNITYIAGQSDSNRKTVRNQINVLKRHKIVVVDEEGITIDFRKIELILESLTLRNNFVLDKNDVQIERI